MVGKFWKRGIRPEVLEAFKKDHQELANQKLRPVLVLGFVFDSFFLLTDYFFGGDQFFAFLKMRILFSVQIFLTYLFSIFFKSATLKSASLLFFLVTVSIEIMLAKMCLLSGGFNSLYFFGFMFVPLFCSAFFPWHPGYQITLSLVSQALYLSQLFFVGQNAPFPTFFTYNWFLLSVGMVTSLSSYMQYSIRLQLKEEEQTKDNYSNSLKRANENLLKVTSQVAHDIRSPLTSLNACVKFWKENPPKEADYLTMLELSAKRLHSIANEVLDKKGQEKTRVAVFSLHRILDELIGEYASGHQQVQFVKQYGEALSCCGNRDRIQRAFSNVIKNAIEAMHGKGQITIKTSLEDSLGVVAVSDTGPGMKPEQLIRVLRGGYTEGKKEGHGIGMQVVREVVQEHGGRLEADSKAGGGATFWIKLPLPDSRLLRSSEVVEEDAGHIELPLKKGDQIVVIDDDPSVQLQWELIFRQEGIEPFIYESYEEYLKKAATRPPLRSAIIDYHYDNSELDGFQIVEKLKQEGYQNLYLCTGEYWKPQIQQRARDLAITICPKPIPKVVVKNP